jgi:murein DD-endopeptidase MepM/ murein hydrolase activator NlpD
LSLKKITIVYLPDGINAVRQYKVPKVLVSLGVALSVFAAAFLVWASIDYLELKKNNPENLSLLQQNSQYKNQLVSLAGKIDQLNEKVTKLKEFETKIRNMVNLDTEEDTQFLGIGGPTFSNLESGDSSEKSQQKLVSLMHQSIDNLDNEISVQTKGNTELFSFLESQKSMFSCTPSIAPADGWVTSRFGYRISPFTNKKDFHSGLDISSRVGTEIISPADGVVASIDRSDGLGISLTLNHGYGFQTLYGHLSKVLVTKGQAVKRGTDIALMGNTGRSTGSHLHYEVHVNEVPVNPERYILN